MNNTGHTLPQHSGTKVAVPEVVLRRLSNDPFGLAVWVTVKEMMDASGVCRIAIKSLAEILGVRDFRPVLKSVIALKEMGLLWGNSLSSFEEYPIWVFNAEGTPMRPSARIKSRSIPVNVDLEKWRQQRLELSSNTAPICPHCGKALVADVIFKTGGYAYVMWICNCRFGYPKEPSDQVN